MTSFQLFATVLLFGWIFGGLAIVFAQPLLERFKDWREHDPLDPANALANTALALIREHPEEWKCDRYRLEHAQTGLSVWIANEDYGITVSAKGATLIPRRRERQALATAFKHWEKGKEERAALDAVADVRSRLRVYEGGKR